MRKSKILVLTLVLVFLVSVSAGALLLDYEEEFGDLDFGGETITYVSWYDHLGSFREGGDYAGRLEEAKERFNIGEVEHIQVGWGDELQEVMMSRLLGGESTYDLWMLPHQQVWTMITDGAFYPMNEVLPQEYYDNLSPDLRAITETFSHQGERYPLALGEDHYMNIMYLAWNKDIFDRHGLVGLDELYQQGDLTWDVVEDYAETTTTDTTGDGEIDQWGFGDFNVIVWNSSNGARVTQWDEDGRMQFTYDQEEALNGLERLLEWDAEGYFGGSWEKEEFRDGYIAMETLALWEFDETHERLQDDWGAVPMPIGPDVDEHIFFAGNVDSFYVPANAAEPEKLTAFHNFLFRHEEWISDREEARVDQAPDQTAYEVLLRAEEEWDGRTYMLEAILGPVWDTGTPFGAIMNPILYEGADPATELAAGRDGVQAVIDDLFDQ